LCEKNTS